MQNILHFCVVSVWKCVYDENQSCNSNKRNFYGKKTEIQTLPNSEMKFLLCVFAIFYRHKKNASNFVEYRYFSDYLKYDTNIQTNSETANENNSHSPRFHTKHAALFCPYTISFCFSRSHTYAGAHAQWFSKSTL